MFQDTYVFTRSGIKNGFIFTGKILLSILLTILTLGNYFYFAITGFLAWTLKGIEINCEAVRCKKLTKKKIFLNIVLYQLFLALGSIISYYLFYATISGTSVHLFLSIFLIILFTLFSFNWIGGYLFHQTISRCSLEDKQILVEGTSASFANRVLKQFILYLPLIIVTGGIYLLWFSVKQLRLLINSCYIERKLLN